MLESPWKPVWGDNSISNNRSIDVNISNSIQ